MSYLPEQIIDEMLSYERNENAMLPRPDTVEFNNLLKRIAEADARYYQYFVKACTRVSVKIYEEELEHEVE